MRAIFLSFYSVFRKEFLHLRRDKSTLRVALLLPCLQIVLFGFIDQTVHDLPMVVVDQDHSVESRLLMDRLQATKTFKITQVTTNPHAARAAIRAGEARAAVIIPPTYHTQRLHRQAAPLLALIDGSDSMASTQALAAVNGLAAQDARQGGAARQPARGLVAQPVILFNPTGSTANYIIPGLIAILLQFVCVLHAASAMVRERERGTLDQLLVTPIHPLGLVLGKLGPYLVLSLVEMTLVLIIMRFGFTVPIYGSVVLLYGTSLVYLLALLALGLLISVRSHTQIEAQQSAQMLVMPAMLLSGYIFPFEGMPMLLRGIGMLFPATHMIAIMRGIVLRSADAFDLWPHIAALGASSVILIYLAARGLHKVVT